MEVCTKAFLTGSGKLFRVDYIGDDDLNCPSLYMIGKSKTQILEWLSYRSDAKYEITLIEGYVDFLYKEIDCGDRDSSYKNMLKITNDIRELGFI